MAPKGVERADPKRKRPKTGLAIEQMGLTGRVLELASRGLSSRAISEQLAAEGYRISHVSVNAFLRRVRQEAREASRQVVQAHVEKSLPTDLDHLERLRDALMQDFEAAKDPYQRAVIANQLRQVLALRLKMAGADQADELAALVERLFGSEAG